MLDFSDFISEHNLIDLSLEGGTFTWSNSRVVASQSRLDRFLLSSDLEEHFPNIRQKRLHRKSTFLTFVKKDCIDYFQITF